MEDDPLSKLARSLKPRFDLADPDDPEQLKQVLDDALSDLGKALKDPKVEEKVSAGITRLMEAEKPYKDRVNKIADKIREDLSKSFPWIGPRHMVHLTQMNGPEEDRTVEFCIQTTDEQVFAVDQWIKNQAKQDPDYAVMTFTIGPEAIPEWIREALNSYLSAPKLSPS